MTYNEFIQNIIDTRGQWNIPDGEYWEGHHIIPKCMGGDGKTYQKHPNIIRLYAKEHFIVHKLLAEENPNNISLVSAFSMMAFPQGKTKRDSMLSPEEYEEARKLFSKLISGENNPMYGRSAYDGKSEEELVIIHDMQSKKRLEFYQNNPDFNKGKNNPMFGHKYSEEDKDRLFNGNNNPFYGHHHTDKVKQKVSEVMRQYKWYTNGIIEVRSKSEIVPKGFHPGKLKRICYTNGEIDIRLLPTDSIPEGFYRGVKPKNKKEKKNDK